MKWLKRKKLSIDPLEKRLNAISELTRGLGRSEFNNLIEATKAVYDARQKLHKVKTEDEKEYGDIETSERILEKEAK